MLFRNCIPFQFLLTILIGDFNTKCASWYSKDNSTTESSKLIDVSIRLKSNTQ